MSRAFVKEPEGDQVGDAPPERPQSEYPNYITVGGLARLKARAETLRRRVRELEAGAGDLSARSELPAVRAELVWLDKRVQIAIPVDPAVQSGDEIRFGATVRLEDGEGAEHAFTIVGEDEADPEHGVISWVSPLGRELLRKRVGDTIRWQRPVGDLELEILSFGYSARN